MHQTSTFPEGEILEVLTYPAPILKKVAEPITTFNEDLRTLATNMLYTMYNAPGIGLAAPQVGHSIQLLCVDTNFKRVRVTDANGQERFDFEELQPLVLINPKIVKATGEIIYQEGCLSFPGIFEDVKRSEKITVEYQDLEGDMKTLETEGVSAICIQHELDHLKGIVFLERLSLLKRNLLLKKFKKNKVKGKKK